MPPPPSFVNINESRKSSNTTTAYCKKKIVFNTLHVSALLSHHQALYIRTQKAVDCVWNVMAHAQKPDFVFRRNGRVHLNRRGASVQLTTSSRGVRNSGSNAGYAMFRGSVKSTGYSLHSPASPSIPLSCVTVCHHVSTGLFLLVCYILPLPQHTFPFMYLCFVPDDRRMQRPKYFVRK